MLGQSVRVRFLCVASGWVGMHGKLMGYSQVEGVKERVDKERNILSFFLYLMKVCII